MSIQAEKRRPARSLATILTFAFLALSLAVLVVAIASQMVFNYQSQRQAIAGKQQSIAQGAASAVAGFVEARFGRLEGAARLSHPLSNSQEEQENILGGLLGLDPALRNLILLDSRDQAVAKGSRVSQAAVENILQQAGSELFVQVRQGDRYIGSMYVDEITSEPMMIMAVPVTNAFGEFQGTLMAEVNLKFMWDLVDQLEVGETGVAYVVDKEGDLIAFGDVARVLRGENVEQLNEVAEFTRSSAPVDETGTSIYSGINKVSVVGTYVPLGTPDWAVVTELPVAEAYRDFTRSVVVSAAILVAMAMLAGFIGVTAARRLAVPLINLTETASRIAEGETGLQAKVEGPREVSTLASAFNDMTSQLRELIAGLEGRTRALETSTRVSQRLSTILDRGQLVAEVVKQVQDAFDYYHVHIYLIDEATQDLVMAGGTGTAGQMLLASGHKIPSGRGLTGRAAATNSPVLVPDVSQEEGWLPNPLLPETKSEVAVPIAMGERALGVLDVQHNVVGGLGEADVDLLQSIAGQVAVALQNTRLFAEAQRRAERQTRVNLVTQRIQSTTTVEDALQVAVRELGRAVEAGETSVRLA
ncbi:MAG: GAF domain-containing protein [Anaerolineae bacterium]|nr:GAF domain-containing protein [Anaerolineae bacterium]